LFALLTLVFSSISLYRAWGDLSIGPYLVATVASLVLARGHRRTRRSGPMGATATRHGDGADSSPASRAGSPAVAPEELEETADASHPGHWGWARVSVFVFVLLGATVIPLSLEIVWRSDGNPMAHVQPEVSVIEQAGHRAAHGLDPYHAVDRHGHLYSIVPGQPAYESFFPYLPLMTVFGLPSSTHEPIRLTDARIFFSLVTFLVVGVALAVCPGTRERKIRALQVLTVLPTAALPLATGGDDMPVVAFLLLAMVLAQRRRPGWSGLVLGVASAMKFTAWPLALLALFAARDKEGKRRPLRMAVGMLVVTGPVVVPFLLRNAEAFYQNVILFPLGLSGVGSPATSPFPGHLIVDAVPSLHRALPVVVAVVGGVVLARYLFRHPPTSAGQVCSLAGWVMLVAIIFAPASRIGYLLYPINFFVWGSVLRSADRLGSAQLVESTSGASPGPGPESAGS